MYIFTKKGTTNTYTSCSTYNNGVGGFLLQKYLEKAGGLLVYKAIREGYDTRVVIASEATYSQTSESLLDRCYYRVLSFVTAVTVMEIICTHEQFRDFYTDPCGRDLKKHWGSG